MAVLDVCQGLTGLRERIGAFEQRRDRSGGSVLGERLEGSRARLRDERDDPPALHASDALRQRQAPERTEDAEARVAAHAAADDHERPAGNDEPTELTQSVVARNLEDDVVPLGRLYDGLLRVVDYANGTERLDQRDTSGT